jgi:2-deoxy-scyllo-inosamine dehydrogenase (SAM-dependent)
MSELHIDAHGDLMLCCEDYLGKRTFGNVRGHTLDEVWSDPDRLTVHRAAIRGDFALDACRGCGYYGAAHADAQADDPTRMREVPR